MASTSTKEDEKGKIAKPSFNLEELRDLADLIEERGFTDFEFENDKIRVRMSKTNAASAFGSSPPQASAPAPAPVSVSPSVSAPAVSEAATNEESDDGFHKITSPIVGTFYRSPGPDKDPFVKEGEMVSSETVVCIVEAMKLMNEIQAETSGEIVRIYVENGQPVEYGQPLFGIKG